MDFIRKPKKGYLKRLRKHRNKKGACKSARPQQVIFSHLFYHNLQHATLTGRIGCHSDIQAAFY